MDEELTDSLLSLEYIKEEDDDAEDYAIEEDDNFVDENAEPIEHGKEGTPKLAKKVDILEVGMEFDTYVDMFDYYNACARQEGLAVINRSQRKVGGVLRYVTIACNQSGKSKANGNNCAKPQRTTKSLCEAKLNAVLSVDEKWQMNKLKLEHNHAISPSNSRFFRHNRKMLKTVMKWLEVNDTIGIQMHKSFASLEVTTGGLENLPFMEKDCRNYIEQVRRLKLGESDAAAI